MTKKVKDELKNLIFEYECLLNDKMSDKIQALIDAWDVVLTAVSKIESGEIESIEYLKIFRRNVDEHMMYIYYKLKEIEDESKKSETHNASQH